jgi:hypothetical protein
MDSLKDKKFLFIALIIIGTSPLGTLFLLQQLIYSIGLGPTLLVIFQLFIYAATFYIHYYCFQRLQPLGFQKGDIIRFFVPVYGLYFAYSFASKLSSIDIEIVPQPKTGKGLNF